MFPKSLRFISAFNNLSLSLWCSPMLGSSRMYATPTRPDPICVARRILCASPPERLAVPLDNVRYSRPTSCKNPTLARISFNIWSPIKCCCSLSSMPSRNTHRSFTDIDVISYMFLSATVTARDDALSRCPLHVVHGVIRINCSYSAFAVSENVSLYLRSTFSTRPFHSRS